MHYQNHDYTQIAALVGVPSLASMRIFNDVCFLFKVLNGIVSCPPLLQQIMLRVPLRWLRNMTNNIFHQEMHTTNYGMYSAIARIVRLGNEYAMLGFTDRSYGVFHHLAKRKILRYE